MAYTRTVLFLYFQFKWTDCLSYIIFALLWIYLCVCFLYGFVSMFLSLSLSCCWMLYFVFLLAATCCLLILALALFSCICCRIFLVTFNQALHCTVVKIATTTIPLLNHFGCAKCIWLCWHILSLCVSFVYPSVVYQRKRCHRIFTVFFRLKNRLNVALLGKQLDIRTHIFHLIWIATLYINAERTFLHFNWQELQKNEINACIQFQPTNKP